MINVTKSTMSLSCQMEEQTMHVHVDESPNNTSNRAVKELNVFSITQRRCGTESMK
jgi:hypothetical protein